MTTEPSHSPLALALSVEPAERGNKLGLAELHREALESFIETNPQKIPQMQNLDNRVVSVEKQINSVWIAVGIAGGLLAVLITSVVAIALAS